MNYGKLDTYLIKTLMFFYGAFLLFMPIFGDKTKSNNLFHMAFILFSLAIVFRKNIREQIFSDRKTNLTIAIVAVFLGWFSLTNLWGGGFNYFLSAINHSLYIIAFILMFTLANALGKKTTIIALVFASITILCLLCFYYVDKRFVFIRRLDDSFPFAPENAIDLGGYFAMGILCGMIMIRETNKKWLYVPLTILFLGLLITQSRGPLFSLCIACLPLLTQVKRNHLHHLIIIALIAVIITFFITLTNYDRSLMNRISMTYLQSFTRVGIWQDALSLIQQKPIFGWGFDKELDFVNAIGQRVHTTHSMYFATLLKGGIIGFILLLAVIVSALRISWLQIKQGQSIEASVLIFSLLFYVSQGMFVLGNPGVSWLLLWLPLAIAITQKKA